MSRVPALALSLVAAAPALAADWVKVPAPGADQHFYDRSKVAIRGDEVTYWRKVVFARPARVRAGMAQMALYQERIHCRDHTLRGLAWQVLADEGATLESSTGPDAEPMAIVPETIGDRFQSTMCALQAARRQREADISREEAALAARRKELDALKAEVERLEQQLQQLRAVSPEGAAQGVPASPAPGPR